MCEIGGFIHFYVLSGHAEKSISTSVSFHLVVILSLELVIQSQEARSCYGSYKKLPTYIVIRRERKQSTTVY